MLRVDREWHLGGLAEALDEAMEAEGTDWPAALAVPASRHRGLGGRWGFRS
jgi:hypothetical protein